MSEISKAVEAIKPLVISAPFGNYVQPAGCTATLGTFTAARRGGVPNRVWRIIKTVRYYRRLKAWVNKIGLRNPGIDWLVQQVEKGKLDVSDKLVSVHGFTGDDWSVLLEKTAKVKPLAIELNMSCPNVGEIDWPEGLFADAVATGVGIVVKVPPVNFEGMFDQAWAAGVRTFHASNTLPVPAGGMSGQPLRPVSLQCVRKLVGELCPEPSELLVVGGGGIYEPGHVDEYATAGARRFAVATKVFNPKYAVKSWAEGGLAGIRSRAESLAE